MEDQIKIVECPRDAMQGWPNPIPTPDKVAYLNQLLKVGFHTLDCVSFVNPKAIPQMADSSQVLEQLDTRGSATQLLAIVLNVRGAETAVSQEKIRYLGYPFSISETFQKLNGNSSISESWNRVKEIQKLCLENQKELVVYISMGFGNPYGDPYDETIIGEWIGKMDEEGIRIISLADTVGLATPDQVFRVTRATVDAFAHTEIGVHLHSTPSGFEEKLDAALQAGCRRFDGALRGIGGCPMAKNDLVGNMDTERMISYFHSRGFHTGIDPEALIVASDMAANIFQ